MIITFSLLVLSKILESRLILARSPHFCSPSQQHLSRSFEFVSFYWQNHSFSSIIISGDDDDDDDEDDDDHFQ